MQEHKNFRILFQNFSIPGHNGLLNCDSVTLTDKIFGKKHLWIWCHMGVILKTLSDFYDLIILKLALFIQPIYCTLWIIGTACFSGLESWKTNLFSHYFINFSFTFLFIVTSIITIVTLLFLLLFSLMLPVLFSFVMCCLFFLLF